MHLHRANRDRPRSLLGGLLDGAPVALPRALDRLAEHWAGAPPRARLAACLAAVIVLLLAAGAGAARSPWGPGTGIVVADRDLPAGHVLAPGDLRVTAWPRALVPADATDDPAELAGRHLAVGVPGDLPVTGAHLADGGLAAGLAADRVALAVSLPDGPALIPGQRLDVLGADLDRGPATLASDVLVLGVEDALVWLAVARHQAPAVAAAAAWGRLAVAVLPHPR